MSDVVISVEKLSKLYRLGFKDEIPDTLAGNLFSWLKAPIKNFKRLRSLTRFNPNENSDDMLWALRDVSFEVKRGEVVGIIGSNGAGKSTLLKILSRITEPTTGRAVVRGRMGSLLEVGTGFHPELTGRENVYMNGTILGMRKTEIDRKFDEIVEFSGVERFLDTPVKRYSSGMKVRLAFAVAAHLDPEILIIDEVLAVGDSAFQAKCLGKIQDVSKGGRTALFVSHNMAAVSALCSRAILLDEGKAVYDNSADQVVRQYLAGMQKLAEISLDHRVDRSGDGSIKITGIRIGTVEERGLGKWVTGKDCMLELDFICYPDRIFHNVEIAVGIRRQDESKILYLGSKVTHQDFETLSGSGTILCVVPRLPLEPAQLFFNTEINCNGIIVDYVNRAATLEVAEGDFYGTGVLWPSGGFLCDYDWSLKQ